MAIKLYGVNADLLSKINNSLITSVVTPNEYLFDDYPAFYGISSARLLKTGIVDIERDRRSSDDAEQDFTPLEKTDGTLTTFTGVGDGFTVTPYDQSGNAFVVTQATKPSQPQSVDTGVLVTSGGKAAWDNAGGFGWESNSNLTLSDASEIWIFAVVDVSDTTGVSKCLCSSTSNGLQVIIRHTQGDFVINNINGTNNAQMKFNKPSNGMRLLTINVKANSTSPNIGKLFIDGIEQSQLDTPAFNSLAFVDSKFIVGAYIGNSLSWDDNISEFLIYKGDQSSNRAAIEANINNYYNIY